MHGRIKTITTEEQQLKQKKIREVKVEGYKTAISAIQEKRKQQDFSDQAFHLTRDILQANPDINTVWNYSRDIILNWRDDKTPDEFQKLLEKELSFTELCLRVNPKSYGTWHHRLWILNLMPTSMWEREVKLCDKYLSLDERNFHCWDYRKLVVAQANIPDCEEYKFTTEKIESNFSNYSAWHYRSKLLPKLFEDTSKILPLEEGKHKEELELVQSAAFTDPDDQSAWFYQRWLLGLVQPKLVIASAHVQSHSIVVALTRSVRLGSGLELEAIVDKVNVFEEWRGTAGESSTVFRLKLANEVPRDAEVIISLKTTGDNAKTLDWVEITQGKPYGRLPQFSPDYGAGLTRTLLEQLTYCQQLLELEPDSKWTLLTSVFLMHSLDLCKYSNEILDSLKRLAVVDKLRRGYYSDLLSKFRIELHMLKGFHLSEISLSGNLSCLYHIQYLVLTTKVCLDDNDLRDIHLKQLHCLLSCTNLSLNGNRIQSLEHLPVLENLQAISLKRNPISEVEKCRNILSVFINLTHIEF